MDLSARVCMHTRIAPQRRQPRNAGEQDNVGVNDSILGKLRKVKSLLKSILKTIRD